MIKCDFCTKSTPDGKCYWSFQSVRESYCKEAIERMTKALTNIEIEKLICKNGLFKR